MRWEWVLALHRAREQTPDEEPSEDYVNQRRRQRGEHRCRHDYGPVDRVGAIEIVQRHRHRLIRRVEDHRHPKEEVIPDIRELKDSHDHKRWQAQWQHDLKERLNQSCAVDACRFDELTWYVREVVAENQ